LWSNDRVRRGRILALDYGSKNVGLAASDELGIVVRPLPSIRNTNHRDLIRLLRLAVREHVVDAVVVGLPLNMNGSSGASAQRVEHLVELLRTDLQLPVSVIDERLSTVEATEMWRGMTPRQQRKYRTVDSLAAALILQRYLEET
jgi:putative holliday junction resolvase